MLLIYDAAKKKKNKFETKDKIKTQTETLQEVDIYNCLLNKLNLVRFWQIENLLFFTTLSKHHWITLLPTG